MRTRASMMQRKKFDYVAEEERHMCEGCNKLSGTLISYCTMYDRVAPKRFIEANECPHNYRRRPAGGKVRVGQGKGKSGGNL